MKYIRYSGKLLRSPEDKKYIIGQEFDIYIRIGQCIAVLPYCKHGNTVFLSHCG